MTDFNFKLSPYRKWWVFFSNLESQVRLGHKAREINASSFDMRMHHLFTDGKMEKDKWAKY